MSQLERDQKDPSKTAGAPYPPATTHDDGPERPRRDVPTADPERADSDVEGSPTESEEEPDAP
jgi:hypothetical protein